jgi:hypothetical protein
VGEPPLRRGLFCFRRFERLVQLKENEMKNQAQSSERREDHPEDMATELSGIWNMGAGSIWRMCLPLQVKLIWGKSPVMIVRCILSAYRIPNRNSVYMPTGAPY